MLWWVVSLLAIFWGVNGLETTLGLVKPDGVEGGHVEFVRNSINASGFEIVAEKELQLTRAQAEEFYMEHSGRGFFEGLVEFMTSGNVVALVLQKDDAIAEWRKLIGPTDPVKAKAVDPQSIRATCGVSTRKNCVHGSDSRQSAAREISVLFDQSVTGALHDEL